MYLGKQQWVSLSHTEKSVQIQSFQKCTKTHLKKICSKVGQAHSGDWTQEPLNSEWNTLTHTFIPQGTCFSVYIHKIKQMSSAKKKKWKQDGKSWRLFGCLRKGDGSKGSSHFSEVWISISGHFGKSRKTPQSKFTGNIRFS